MIITKNMFVAKEEYQLYVSNFYFQHLHVHKSTTIRIQIIK